MASRPLALLALAALLGVVIRPPAAQADEPPPAASGGWDVEFVPYLWLTEVHGSMSVRGVTAPIDVGFDEVFDLLGDGDLIGGMGHLEARHRRIVLFVDAVGSVVRTDQQLRVGKANLAADIATVEFGGGYRVYEAPGGAISVDGLVGGRYNYLYNSIAVDVSSGETGPQRGATTQFVDPFVGGRWSVRLVDWLSLQFRGDIGGFGAGSQLAWSLNGGFRIQTPWTVGSGRLYGIAGYKVYDFDYESGSGAGRRSIAEEFRGPALGLGATF